MLISNNIIYFLLKSISNQKWWKHIKFANISRNRNEKNYLINSNIEKFSLIVKFRLSSTEGRWNYKKSYLIGESSFRSNSKIKNEGSIN